MYSYETACEEYLKALEDLQRPDMEQETPGGAAISSVAIQFVVNRVSLPCSMCCCMAAWFT